MTVALGAEKEAGISKMAINFLKTEHTEDAQECRRKRDKEMCDVILSLTIIISAVDISF